MQPSSFVIRTKTDIENAVYEGLRIGLATRMTNLFVVLSSGGAAPDAEANFTNGVRLALKNYQICQNILAKELENIS